MDNESMFSVGAVVSGLVTAVGVLWKRLVKQQDISREDQKVMTDTLLRTIEAVSKVKGGKNKNSDD